MARGPRRRPRLRWVTEAPPRRVLWREGYDRVRYGVVRRTVEEALRTDPAERSLDPLVDLDRWFPPGGRVAVLGAQIRGPGDLRVVTRFVLNPAYRRGCDLLLWARPRPDALPGDLSDRAFGYGWTRERFGWLLDRYDISADVDEKAALTRTERRLRSLLREKDLEPRVLHQIGSFEVGLALPDRRLAVEVDGRGWYDEVRDRQRDAELREQGWTILRFPVDDVRDEPEQCAATVAARYEELDAAPALSAPLEPPRSGWRQLLERVWPLAGEDPGSYGADPGAVVEHAELDDRQLAAVTADDGVTQVVAPAGSGKTRVLVERVRELLGRGVPPRQILCTTFNRDAADELDQRLREAGVRGVEAGTFHGTGHRILREDGLLPPGGRLDLSRVDGGTIIRRVSREPGATRLSFRQAKDWISRFKLSELAAPHELTGEPADPLERAAREVYARYQQELERRDAWDFDDLLFLSVRHLRSDRKARRRWQRRWRCVLVDEYQDIEPAQELLVQILAAPQDCLFVVGDEDQCIYAWRRAKVERLVQLDHRYPTLERVLLGTNYRCASSIVEAASKLIRHNAVRFDKGIRPARATPGTIAIEPSEDATAELSGLRAWLETVDGPETAAVLCRTRAPLRDLAVTCLEAGLPVHADGRILRSSRAEETVLAHLVLTHDPDGISIGDLETVFRGSRGSFPRALVPRIAEGRGRGTSFVELLSRLSALEAVLGGGITGLAPILDALAEVTEAVEAVRLLRGEVDLDRRLRRKSGSGQGDEIEALASIERLAEGITPERLLDLLRTRRERLEEARDSEDGIELTTIHGAKGREWPRVALMGAHAHSLPHPRTLEEAGGDEGALRTAREEERRLAYVALTRAEDHLRVSWSGEEPTPFLVEAGLVEGPVRTEEVGSRRRPRRVERRGGGGPVVTAGYDQRCPACGERIRKGRDEITPGSDGWVHAGCA